MTLQRALVSTLGTILTAKVPAVTPADVRPSSNLYEPLNPGQVPAHFGLERTLENLRPIFQEAVAAAWKAIVVPEEDTRLVAEEGDLLYSTIQEVAGRLGGLLELSVRFVAAKAAAEASGDSVSKIKPGTKLSPVGSGERALFVKRLQKTLLAQLKEKAGLLSAKELAKLNSAVTYGDAVAVLVPKYLKAMEVSL